MEAAAAARHHWIAGRLGALAQRGAAEVVARVAQSEDRQAVHESGEATLTGRDEQLPEGAPALLRAALAEVEKLHDAYLDLADRTRDEQVLAEAQAAAARTMSNLGSIAAQLHSPPA